MAKQILLAGEEQSLVGSNVPGDVRRGMVVPEEHFGFTFSDYGECKKTTDRK
jgi:hypothetical protein